MQNNKPIWFELNLATFGVRQEGCQEKTLGQKALYVTPGLEKLISATELADAEYGLAVEVDLLDRTVLFGRDYLGHYPLMYACTESHLYISDDAFQIKGVLENEGIELTLSEQSLALYFSMGYIPQGMTAYSQIKSCENTSLYRWKRGAITKISLFEPVEVNEAFSVTELGERIEHEVAKLAATSNAIEVWC